MMSEEKKENSASEIKKTENPETEEKTVQQPETAAASGKTEAISEEQTAEKQKQKNSETVEKEKTETLSQPQKPETGNSQKQTAQNGSAGNVPPVSQIPVQKKEKKKHSGIWKIVLKYVLVFLVAGCGAFAGSYLAENIYHEKMKNEVTRSFQDFGNMIPFGGESENQSSGPALGITIQQTDDGIEIVGFADNSNAEKAGLKLGDIITKVDGKSYDSVSEISSYISSKSVGDKVKVTVKRNGEEKTCSVKLVKKDLSAYSVPSAPADNNDSDSQDTPKALPGTDGGESQFQG